MLPNTDWESFRIPIVASSPAGRLGADQRELFLLALTLDDDRRLHQDQQHLVVLGHRSVREDALEERDLREDRHTLLTLDLTGERLAAQQQGAAVGDADGRVHTG